jgi:integrase
MLKNRRDPLTQKQDENHLILALGNLKIPNLKSMHLQRFFTTLAKSEMKRISQKHIYSILRNSLKDGSDFGINADILKKIKAPSVGKSKLDIWNNEEVSQFLAVASENRYYIAFLLAITTGMRQGE